MKQNMNGQCYIHGSVHRNSILIRSNKMQVYAGIYLAPDFMFRVSSHQSSGVQKTVTAASGIGNVTYQSNDIPSAWPN